MDELRSALELATEQELQDLTHILFHRKLNPLDYVRGLDPIVVQEQDYGSWLDALEQRFRFLAADGLTVLKGQTEQVTYRQILIRVCHHLKLDYSSGLSTIDLESEIFLNLLGRYWRHLPARDRQILNQRVKRSLGETASQLLPAEMYREPLRLLFEGSSALLVSSIVQPLLLRQVARQFALHFANYQAAIAGAALPVLQRQVAVQTARHGMALTAARYGATRGVLAAASSVLWVWFVADLGWRAIATNYGRVIPTIFALAQIRLTREAEWAPA